MNTPAEHDPQLEALFANAAIETPNGDFADRVMNGVDRRRRNVWVTRIGIVAAIVLLEVLLAAPVKTTIGAFAYWLSAPLFPMDDGWVSTLLDPFNSAAGIVGALLLCGHILYRKVIR